MLDFLNHTDWNASIHPSWSIAGERQLTCVLKQSWKYTDNGATTVPDYQNDMVEYDIFNCDDMSGYLTHACEIVPFKKGSELLISGECISSDENCRIAKTSWKIVKHGEAVAEKSLYVHGERTWERKGFYGRPSMPLSFKRLPITYQYAYGGFDKGGTACDYNPAGMGYAINGKFSKSRSLPHIQNAAGATGLQVVAGFGPVAAHWRPRRDIIPEVDESSVQAGLYPFKTPAPPNMYNYAPDNQQFDFHLSGDHIIIISGMSENGIDIIIELPKSVYEVNTCINGIKKVRQMSCDTLAVDTLNSTYSLLYRLAIPYKTGDIGFITLSDMAHE